MSRPKKISLILLAILAAIICCAIPFSLKPIALYWAKHKAHQIFKDYTAEDMRNINAVPISITLPKPPNNASVLSSFQSPRYLYHFPLPQSQEFKNGTLRLTYPQFKVFFLIPVSTRKNDAEFLTLVHMDTFQCEAAIAHARPDDIDAQPDLKSLSYLLSLLSGKGAGFSRSTYYAQFDQPGRRGFISARYASETDFHTVIYFSPAQISCGMYFESTSKIDPADVQSSLSILEIEPSPASTSPATRP